MRYLLLGLSILVACGSAHAQESIRRVDFKNFTYPLSGSTLGHTELKWLDISTKRRVQLVHGQGLLKSSGFKLNSVTYADVTGDGKEEGVVVIHLDTGGTQQTDYVYIFTMVASDPKLLAYFHTGDRAYGGLHRVYGNGGNLVVELFDEEKREGDCCSSGFIRTRYKWSGDRFKTYGVRKTGVVKTP